MQSLTDNLRTPDARPRLSLRQTLWLGATAAALLALIVTLAVRLHQAQQNLSKVPPYPLIGHQAPNFTLPLLNPGQEGKTLTLSDLRGKAVMVNIWASWCDACKLETPALQQISERYADKGLVVVGVAFQRVQETPAAQAFAKHYGITYPLVLDDDGVVAVAFGTPTPPWTVLITRDGKVLDRLAGGQDLDQFDAAAKRLLAS